MEFEPGADTTTTTNNNNAESMTDPKTRRVLNIAYATGVLMETPSGYFKAMSWESDGHWHTRFISGEWFSLEYPSLRMTIDGGCVQRIEFRAYLHNQHQERWVVDAKAGAVERHAGRESGAPERVEIEGHPGIFYIPATDWTDRSSGAQCRHALLALRRSLIAFLRAQNERTTTRGFLLLHQLVHHITTMTDTGPPKKYTTPKNPATPDSAQKVYR